MARKPHKKPRPASKASIKAAADRAEKRAKGEDVDDPKVAITPEIKPAAALKKEAEIKRKRGRPTKYTPAVHKAICKMLASGMSVRAIGRRAKMPSATQILTWGRDPQHPFSVHYARAREIGYLHMAEEVIEIADDGSNDWMQKYDKDGGVTGWTINGEAVARSKLRLDTRKWILSKMLPKIYAERTAVEHTGKDGAPIQIEDVGKLDLARWIAHQLTQAQAAPKALEVEENNPG
jgi:hypothetical protein